MLCRQWLTALLLSVLSTQLAADEPSAMSVSDNVKSAEGVVADSVPAVAADPDLKKSSLYPSLLASNAANNAKKSTAVGSGLVTADPIKVVGGLLFVVAIIFLVAWLMRRLGAIPAFTGQTMRVVSALSVGTREKIILVDVAGQQILLGVAPGRVNHLQTFEQAVITPASNTQPNTGDFAKTIRKLLHPATEQQVGSSNDSAGKLS
ncbi:flagellar biosynthetic protein FliO [Oceanicoccus sp. KOV_DT_Chl]|uniref:flagellar biosynthetic protein FliO n=1 Tax=Oceanicoccus sp. KOV_DT_Chl TaxID=1904639 RepID=UPI000C7D9A09|nr:flagellar biosynthetic protein FliO [Oceanicoccus sp. KOV_DT_Chl]